MTATTCITHDAYWPAEWHSCDFDRRHGLGPIECARPGEITVIEVVCCCDGPSRCTDCHLGRHRDCEQTRRVVHAATNGSKEGGTR